MRVTQGDEGAGRTLTEHHSPVAVTSAVRSWTALVLPSLGRTVHRAPQTVPKGRESPNWWEQDTGSRTRTSLEGLSLRAGGILSYNPGVKLLLKPGCPAGPLGIQSSLFIKLLWTFYHTNL